MSLRAKAIRLAATLPPGSMERKALLDAVGRTANISFRPIRVDGSAYVVVDSAIGASPGKISLTIEQYGVLDLRTIQALTNSIEGIGGQLVKNLVGAGLKAWVKGSGMVNFGAPGQGHSGMLIQVGYLNNGQEGALVEDVIRESFRVKELDWA